jgi:hypothetical protein
VGISIEVLVGLRGVYENGRLQVHQTGCLKLVEDDGLRLLAYMDEFEKLDEDKDGKLNRREIAALLRSVDVQPTWLELDHLFREMDTDSKRNWC